MLVRLWQSPGPGAVDMLLDLFLKEVINRPICCLQLGLKLFFVEDENVFEDLFHLPLDDHYIFGVCLRIRIQNFLSPINAIIARTFRLDMRTSDLGSYFPSVT